MTRSSSLRRANSMKRFNNKTGQQNRDSTGSGGSPPALSRCGTGGSLERPSARRSFRKCNLEARNSSFTSENNSPKTSVDSGYGGNCERNSRALEQPQSQPVNETQRRQRRERSKDNDEYQRELRLVRFKLDEERALNSKLEEKIRLHNVKMKEIALKMDRVDKEFQKKEFQIFQLDSQLQDAHAVIRQLSSKLNDECSQKRRSSDLNHDEVVSQKQIRDLQELKEFLHVENATLLETLKDGEFENERLKLLVEQKDGELSKSEEQTRHLVRLSEKRHQEILSVTFKLNTLERKAREIILNQALAMEKSMRKLKDEAFDNQNIFKFLQKISQDLDDMLIFKDHYEQNEAENVRGKSLEDLSLSIRNRMKVEKAGEDLIYKPKNSIMEQLSKFEALLLSDLNNKIEE
eukprot:06633.XXX_67141_73575_1 [CDS] Oithona nana genome sequencing.